MRWLGAAQRAHDIAADYAHRRTAFGKPIGEHEGVGFMLADNEMDIHQSRLVICPRTAGPLFSARGRPFGPFRGSEAIWRIVDRSMQILGGLGITDDTIVARLFREVRPFRIYDGPSEVHRCRSPAAYCGPAGRHSNGDRCNHSGDRSRRDVSGALPFTPSTPPARRSH
jgi:acyl-CoA dehydrogenase